MKFLFQIVYNVKFIIIIIIIKMNVKKIKEEILEAKRRLYLLLMKLNEDTITDNEVDIMFLLSKDEQIHSLFETQKKK